MKALVFLLKTTIINYFKRLKEKPQKAIGPAFVIIWIAILFLPKGKSIGNDMPPEAFVSIFIGFTLIMTLWSLYSGTKRVDSKFTMGDVNLIFVSPIKPQTIMIYGIIKKAALELFASFYILYQIPNLLRSFNVSIINKSLLILTYIVFQIVFCNVLKLFVFALNTKFNGLGKIIRHFIKVLVLFIIAGITFLIIKGDIGSFIENLTKTVTYNTNFKYIPLFGWLREISVQTITGLKMSYIIYFALIVLLSFLLIYITYAFELDFYEDMLSSAEKNELIVNIKSGKNYPVANNDNSKLSFLFKPFRKIKLNLNEVYGAKVLFFKHMNEYFKRSFIFFINTYSLILLTVSIILGLIAKSMDIKIIFLAADVILFFSMGFGGKIYEEITHYFIFLLPDSPQKKLFYGISSSLIKILTDSLLLFVPFGLLTKASIVEILLCIVCYVTLGGMLSYSGLFAYRISEYLGFTGVLSQSLFFMFFQFLIIIPAAGIVGTITIFLSGLTSYAIYLALLAYSVALSALFSIGSVGIFNNMEFRE